MTRVMRFLGPLAALSLAAAAPQTFSRDELDRVESEKQEAEARLAALDTAKNDFGQDVARLDEQLISAALESRRREEQASAAEMRLVDLQARQVSVQSALLDDRDALEEVLAALVSSAQQRPPALAVSPDRANESIRAAILIGDAAPQLSERAEILSEQIVSLAKLERDIRRERTRLETAEATLALKKQDIERLAAEKRSRFEELSGDAETLRRQVAVLAERAATLRDLLAALEAEAPSTPGRKPDLRLRLAALAPSDVVSDATPDKIGRPLRPLGASENGAFISPAAGLVARAFGDRGAGGVRQEGVTIVTRRDAQVVAPADGTIEFAETFRSYGPTLILRTSDDYHIVLSGLAAIYGAPGQEVAAGEPVGRMPNRAQSAPELYIELRRNNEVLDPEAWIQGGR